MSELLPCPMCGNPAKCSTSGAAYRIYCSNEDGCTVSTGYWQNEHNVVQRWNTRPPSQPGREEVARIIVGPVCDATKADHNIMRDGRYAFCTQCGETVTKPQIGQADALTKADSIISLFTKGAGEVPVTGGREASPLNWTAPKQCDHCQGHGRVGVFACNHCGATGQDLSRNSTDE